MSLYPTKHSVSLLSHYVFARSEKGQECCSSILFMVGHNNVYSGSHKSYIVGVRDVDRCCSAVVVFMGFCAVGDGNREPRNSPNFLVKPTIRISFFRRPVYGLGIAVQNIKPL